MSHTGWYNHNFSDYKGTAADHCILGTKMHIFTNSPATCHILQQYVVKATIIKTDSIS
jgi:hypothetical protein